MKLGSLFDGIGGFPYAGQLEGFTPVWASEIEASPISITKRHFPAMKHLGDITEINGGEIEPVDVITFGSPCTRLSQAGKHDGFDISFICFGNENKDEENDEYEDEEKKKEAHFEETFRALDKYQYEYTKVCPVCGKLLTATNESALFFHAIRVIEEMREKTDGAA